MRIKSALAQIKDTLWPKRPELLSYNELVKLVEAGVIEGAEPEHINAASIDVRLGKTIMVEKRPTELYLLDVGDKESFTAEVYEIGEEGIELRPGEFILAHTQERFNLPDDLTAQYKLKSSGARIGLDCALATWCDPGWHGSTLTLELRNNLRYHSLLLRPGILIGQMIFERVKKVPEQSSYAVKGRYNCDGSVQRAKTDAEADAEAANA